MMSLTLSTLLINILSRKGWISAFIRCFLPEDGMGQIINQQSRSPGHIGVTAVPFLNGPK